MTGYRASLCYHAYEEMHCCGHIAASHTLLQVIHATQTVALQLPQIPPALPCMLELPLPLIATDAVATPPCFALPADTLACFAAARSALGKSPS